MKRLIASLAAATALATAAPAAADGNIDPSEQFYGDTNADTLCIVIAAYPTPDGVLGAVMGVMHDGFAPDSAVDIVNYSVATYCNQWWPLLVRTGDIYRQGPLKRAM